MVDDVVWRKRSGVLDMADPEENEGKLKEEVILKEAAREKSANFSKKMFFNF